MVDLVNLKADCEARWAKCQILPSRAAEVRKATSRLCAPANKVRFQGVSDRLAEMAANDPTIKVVPWWFIAIVSEREYGPDQHGNQRWNCQLGQGDPLNAPSSHVPRGMGPYLDHPGDSTPGHDAWTRCCVDVLINSAPYVAKTLELSIGGVLIKWIDYNGIGYEAYHDEPSPYDWGATNIEQRGKYSGDGQFSPNMWDTQIGCAAMLKDMMAIDPSIVFDAPIVAKPSPVPAAASPAAAPVKVGTRIGTVNTLSLNVRKAAGVGSPVITRLLHGASVTITGETMVMGDKWYDVGKGFVAAQYVDIKG